MFFFYLCFKLRGHPYFNPGTCQHLNNQLSLRKNILMQDPHVPTWNIYLICFPGGDDPSTLSLSAIKLSFCLCQLKEIFVCLMVSLSSLEILYNKRRQQERPGWYAALCTDSNAGVDRHCVSALRVPSESNAGGLYKDVFLQITRWANIQKPAYCVASRVSISA